MENQMQFLLAQRLSNGPSIIIVRGMAYVTLGGRTTILTKDGLTSRKHGFVQLLYAEDSWGVVQHLTVKRGVSHILFIPPKKRMNLSNGYFALVDVNYESFVQAHDQGTMLHPTYENTNINQIVEIGYVCGTKGDHSLLISINGGGLGDMLIPGTPAQLLRCYLNCARKKAYKIRCANCPETFWSLIDLRKIHSTRLFCGKCSSAS